MINIKRVKNIVSIIVLIIITIVLTVSCTKSTNSSNVNKGDIQAKNVILFISDGMSPAHVTLTRWYKGENLELDRITSGSVKTHWQNGPITDSAPAATAMATGQKSSRGYVGMYPTEKGINKPIPTILEGAKLKGKATGIIATLNIQTPTIAAFSSHNSDSDNYFTIAEHQVYNDIDVVLGAGSFCLEAKHRKDKKDLLSVINEKGYDYVTTIEDMKKSTATKLWGMFDPIKLSYDMDRNPKEQPSLAEMTEKAIEILSKNSDGFFLVVEGSKIDWAAHANDPIGVISEVLAFDKAAKVALDFALKDKNTVVISTSDHNTGGMSFGNNSIGKSYDRLTLESFIEPLKKASMTADGVRLMVQNEKEESIKQKVIEYYGLDNLSEDEYEEILENRQKLNRTIGPMLSKRANIGWVSDIHVGDDCTLYSYHPKVQHRLTGTVDNTDIAKYIASVLDINLEDLNNNLFVSVNEGFEAKGATVKLDNSDKHNPVAVITKNSDVLKLYINKNIAEFNGEIKNLSCISIFEQSEIFASKEVLDFIK